MYGKHTQGTILIFWIFAKNLNTEVEKQEKKFRERKTKRKGEEKEEKKEEHPSWQARKKAKAESSIKQFEGTKVVFDDSDWESGRKREKLLLFTARNDENTSSHTWHTEWTNLLIIF